MLSPAPPTKIISGSIHTVQVNVENLAPCAEIPAAVNRAPMDFGVHPVQKLRAKEIPHLAVLVFIFLCLVALRSSPPAAMNWAPSSPHPFFKSTRACHRSARSGNHWRHGRPWQADGIGGPPKSDMAVTQIKKITATNTDRQNRSRSKMKLT
ncbi:hypothetical protein ACLOJK_019095 [Asimina triloba]